jgi:hypothetical protein
VGGEGFNQSLVQGCGDKHPHHTLGNLLKEVSVRFSECMALIVRGFCEWTCNFEASSDIEAVS